MPKFIDKISYLDATGVDVELNQVQGVATIDESTLSVANADHATNADNVHTKSGSYKTMVNALLEMVYPIGSIYISTNNVSPQNFLGGTWVRFANGQVLVGVNESENSFSSVLKTGGSKEQTLTVDQLPSHTHAANPHFHSASPHRHGFSYIQFDNPNYFNRDLTNYADQAYIPCSKKTDGSDMSKTISAFTEYSSSLETTGTTVSIKATGGSQPHNNLQPYITVYMWRRTA